MRKKRKGGVDEPCLDPPEALTSKSCNSRSLPLEDYSRLKKRCKEVDAGNESVGSYKSRLAGIATAPLCGTSSLVTPGRGIKRKIGCIDVATQMVPKEMAKPMTAAFTTALNEACRSRGRVHLIIPRGTYIVGPLKFSGPCQEGYLKATTALSKYESGGGWVQFAWIKGLTLTGGGTFDGQGAKSWPHNKCSKDSNCKLLPVSHLSSSNVNTATNQG